MNNQRNLFSISELQGQIKAHHNLIVTNLGRIMLGSFT